MNKGSQDDDGADDHVDADDDEDVADDGGGDADDDDGSDGADDDADSDDATAMPVDVGAQSCAVAIAFVQRAAPWQTRQTGVRRKARAAVAERATTIGRAATVGRGGRRTVASGKTSGSGVTMIGSRGGTPTAAADSPRLHSSRWTQPTPWPGTLTASNDHHSHERHTQRPQCLQG